MNLFAKARNGANLSPAERSFLRLLEGLAATAIVAALPVVSDALSRGTVDWADVGRAALAAGSTAALLAILKYAKAQADAPLGASATPSVSASASDPFAPLVLPSVPESMPATPEPSPAPSA